MNNNAIGTRLQRFSCVLALVVVFAFAKADAQQPDSTTNKTQFSQASFQVVYVDLKEYLALQIQTNDGNEVSIQTSQNGEYKNAIILSTSIRNDSLLITDPISPTFSFPKDKLSAHKVIDARAILTIPKNKKLVIHTGSADMKLTGVYQSLYVNQLSGTCTIVNTEGNINYVSVYGNLYMHNPYYKTTAHSRSGMVDKFSPPELIKYFALLESISGDIKILKKRNK